MNTKGKVILLRLQCKTTAFPSFSTSSGQQINANKYQERAEFCKQCIFIFRCLFSLSLFQLLDFSLKIFDCFVDANSLSNLGVLLRRYYSHLTEWKRNAEETLDLGKIYTKLVADKRKEFHV